MSKSLEGEMLAAEEEGDAYLEEKSGVAGSKHERRSREIDEETGEEGRKGRGKE